MDIFCGELNDTKIVHNILKAITFKEYAEISIMEEGLKITIEDMKSVRTSAYILKRVFSTYNVRLDEEKINFQVNLKILTECLDIFGEEGQPSLKLIYRAVGAPFCLVLTHSEGCVTADCEVKTLEVEDGTDWDVGDQYVVNKFLVEAPPFVDMLNFLDLSCEVIEILVSPEPPYIQFSTHGSAGLSQITISKLSDVVVTFDCTTICSFQYAFPHIRQIMKVMNLANKISMTTSDNGILGLQLIITTETEHTIFVEYSVMSVLDN